MDFFIKDLRKGLFLMLLTASSVSAWSQGILPSFMRRADPAITNLNSKLNAEQARSEELRKLMEQLKKEKDELSQMDERDRNKTGRTQPRPKLRLAALVIGNSRYTTAPLPNPVKDAAAVAELLTSFGYEVELLLDGSRRQIVDALTQLRRRAAEADVALLFYAGHGAQVENTNYIIPVDMHLTEGSMDVDGIALNQVIDRYLPSKIKLVFLDACRNNPLSGKGMVAQNVGSASVSAGATVSPAGLAIASRTITGDRNLAVGKTAQTESSATGTLISYATKDGFVASDGEGNHSPYTQALLQHLKNDADISLVLRRVRQQVLEATGGQQVPWEYGSLIGDELILARQN
ncbi:MAG: caspase domain-containing protein [Hylemonella sp.]